MNFMNMFKVFCSFGRFYIVLDVKRYNLKIRFFLDDEVVQVSICGNIFIKFYFKDVKLKGVLGLGFFDIVYEEYNKKVGNWCRNQ